MKRAIQALAGRLGYRIVRLRGVTGDLALAASLELVIPEYLDSRGDTRPFFFIQIGAFDGLWADPLHEYVRQYGWKGILVEPQARYFEALVRNYEGCEGLEFVQAAVTSEPGVRMLHTIRDPRAPGLPEWAPGIASLSLETVLRHRDEIPDIAERVVSEEVRCITFDDLLAVADTDHVDLILIDAEGYDFEILKMIDLPNLRPGIVRFEHKHLRPAELREAVYLLASLGYRLLQARFDTTAYLYGDEPPLRPHVTATTPVSS